MTNTLLSVLLFLFTPLAALHGADETKPPAAIQNGAVTGVARPDSQQPTKDRERLEPNTKLNTALPNVLLIGDSISIGYTKTAAGLLKDVANVQRPGANCGDTTSGLRNLERWLGTTRWDVIHFNWGLHDLCYRHPESKTQGRRDKVKGTLSVPLDQYEKNLEELVQRLEKTGAKLIWAATTVVPEGEEGRFVGDDVKYNAAARRVMEKHGIPVDDLHTLTAGFTASYFSGKGNVHFTEEGYTRIARQVAESIRQHGLAAKNKP